MADERISVEAIIAERVAERVLERLRPELDIVRADLAALKQAAPPPLVDVAEFCRFVGVSPATARRMAAHGDVKVVRRGRVVRYDLSSLRRPEPEEVARLAREARRR